MKKKLWTTSLIAIAFLGGYVTFHEATYESELFLDGLEALANPENGVPNDLSGEILMEPECLYDIRNGENIMGIKGICIGVSYHTSSCTEYACKE